MKRVEVSKVGKSLQYAASLFNICLGLEYLLRRVPWQAYLLRLARRWAVVIAETPTKNVFLARDFPMFRVEITTVCEIYSTVGVGLIA